MLMLAFGLVMGDCGEDANCEANQDRFHMLYLVVICSIPVVAFFAFWAVMQFTDNMKNRK
ncbi:hypothetical protein HFP57_08290 [Parasphingopyxis algicola]|uniref:hypothetical protein n=1 Tax=Parasphingopyxis algicola TaxID=2026624 RepID=UPI0015A0407E|nr:hypothetical protein [Parasphingopyxis algicola]QLC25024.1 hypothetical protein HFP57_08290 [Parasphingopyxis algicola]